MLPSPEQIRRQVGTILASRTFAQAERMRRFLGFIVEHCIRTPEAPLKEVIIGMELYAGNDGDFDPRMSATVRVDATRLRAKLREYYASEGASDSLIIDLPKGRYTPTFLGADARTLGTAATSTPEPSIAVLPFANLSPDPEDFFSDGLTEEIIHLLASAPGLRVVARTSAFALKHRNADVRHVGQALNVAYVLEGSIRKSNDALRITAHLVSTADGYQMWSQRYERSVGDVFAVQDEIAREIVTRLRLSTGTQVKPVPVSESFEAYSLYLEGRYHLNRQTRASFHCAIERFEKALAQSPSYAPAHSGMAVGWLYVGVFADSPPLDVLPKASDAAARALAIDPKDGDALAVAASTLAILHCDWPGAEKLFRQSLRVQPMGDVSGHLFAMFALLPMARIDEALDVLEEARRVDPLSLFVSASRGAVLLMARRNDEAEAQYRRTLALDPHFWRALLGLGRCYEASGRFDEAIACFEHARTVSNSVPTSIGALGHALALSGRKEEARGLLAELDVLASTRYESPFSRVLILLGLLDDAVFDWLDRAYRERAAWMMYTGLDARFDPVRNDPRFQSLLSGMGLPQPRPSRP